MPIVLKRFAVCLCVAWLSACASLPAPRSECVGTIETPPAALVDTSDPALLGSALGQPGKGALCTAQVFVAEQPVKVYRVWDASKPYTAIGSWWSLTAPTGPRDQYRLDNAICPEWSALDKVSYCSIKVGVKVAIGPGQSAQCANAMLPASANNQVYIPNDTRNNVVLVEQCSEGADWPTASE